MVEDFPKNSLYFLLKEKGINDKIIDFVVAIVTQKNEAKRILKAKFTNGVHYRVFKSIPLKCLRSVMISPNYAIIHYKYTVKRKRYYSEDTYEVSRTYLVGINDDGKYFINQIPIGLAIEYQESRYIGDVELFLIKDDIEIFVILGYQSELKGIIDKENETIRVQGDLTLVTQNFQTFYLDLLESLRNQIREQIRDYVLRTIRDLLTQARIESEIIRRTQPIITFRAIPYYLKYESQKEVLFKVIDFIRRKLVFEIDGELYKCTMIKEQYYNHYALFFENNKGDDIMVIIAKDSRLGFGNRYYGVSINVEYISAKIYDDIARKVFDDIKERINQFQEVKLEYGNHRIVIDRAIPNRFTIETEFLPEKTTLNISAACVIVDEDSKMVLSHDEHKMVYVKFGKKMAISFSTIQVNDDVDRLNYYAIKELPYHGLHELAAYEDTHGRKIWKFSKREKVMT